MDFKFFRKSKLSEDQYEMFAEYKKYDDEFEWGEQDFNMLSDEVWTYIVGFGLAIVVCLVLFYFCPPPILAK
jgi:hypothetical protein